MMQKGTFLGSSDKNGVLVLYTIHVYGNSFKKMALLSNFMKLSVSVVKFNFMLKKKEKMKGIFILSKKNNKKNDYSFFSFKYNMCVTLSKSLNTVGSEVFGPGLYMLKSRRFLFSFAGML